jgi:hypothetical protein
VLLRKDAGIGDHKSLGHFVCTEASRRPPSSLLLSILEVLEEQFGQLVQPLFRQAADIIDLLFKFISTEKLEQDGIVTWFAMF